MMYNTLNELPKFWGALYGGLVIGILYDVFRLLRLPFHKHRLVTGFIDALFYAVAGVIAALTLLYVNGGAPRVYLFAGLALGAFVYIRFVGRLFNSLLISISRAFRKKTPAPKS
ncbi:MAG TPA: spore cortex biosynthesis protein YabQ [Clostridia bacterium]|nr:spore cortex biosynthesis protein YabQ [Clostridia bacterium]